MKHRDESGPASQAEEGADVFSGPEEEPVAGMSEGRVGGGGLQRSVESWGLGE